MSVATAYNASTASFPIHAVEIQEQGTRHVYFWCKRIIDVVLAAFLFVVLFPLMLLIAVLIKLDSAGPVLFVQQRIGVKRRTEHGRIICALRTFPFYKFRSMVANADQSIHEVFIRNFREGYTETSSNGTRFKLA